MSRLVQLSILLAILAAGYQFWLQPILTKLGVGRVVSPLNNTKCTTVAALAACEKLVLHPSSGLLFLACSTPESRAHWVPAVNQIDPSGPDASVDYLATYDATTGKVTRLELPLGVHTHGLDVVPSADENVVYVYAVNHRKPADGEKGRGPDSTIEVFSMTVGQTALTHLHTIRHPAVLTPNDVVGSPDGRSVFFTNDHTSKTGWTRALSLLGLESGSVGFCSIVDASWECKIVAPNLHGANGIAATNDTFFVANCVFGGIYVLERQSDNALLQTHTIPTEHALDNLSIDEDGVVYAAGIPAGLTLLAHIADPKNKRSPSSAFAVSKNVGPGSFYGEKFVVEKVFEDDGALASGTTSVVHDVKRGKLYMNGIAAPHLTVCSDR
ncbi:Serum paraoxonase/arylesterase 2 [Mycena chlorophos]|uniref:Serum paraoxonase/arylesterase 2 n=1 Tax=Mycena chlorophos TaxID=658473 RepID=A0A8H6SBQ8_MYCCL|nr:Serum paraoxonase/arylesterase 2 [Mycena chlorophos]